MPHDWLFIPLAGTDPVTPIIAWWKLVPVTLFCLIWLKSAEFTNLDCQTLGLNRLLWVGAVLGAGLLGFLMVLVLPVYGVGLAVQIILTMGSVVAYVFYRNGKVSKDQRLGSLATFQNAILAQFGRRAIPTREQAPDTEKTFAILDHMGRVIVRPENLDEQAGHDAARRILFEAVFRRAGEMELVLTGEGQVFFKIDGVVSEQEKLERTVAEQMIGLVKTYAKLDRSETRKPQEGYFNGKALNKDLKMHVHCQGSREGQRLRIRFLGEDVTYQIINLGLLPRQVEEITALQQTAGGLFIVAGKHGHGLSTTMYALARGHDAFMRNMISFERRTLMKLENIKQVVLPTDTISQSIASEITSALTSDPDILLVDPLDNAAAAQAVLEAVRAGKKVYVSIPQPDTFTALAQWLKWTGDLKLGAEKLQAVMAQRVLRKLCVTCREAYAPDPAILKKANLPADKVKSFYRTPTRPLTDAKGKTILCQDCQGTGYVGQTGLYELFVITDEARKLIAEGAPLNPIKAEARRTKMLYLQEVGLRRVIEGVTSIQEVLRVTQE